MLCLLYVNYYVPSHQSKVHFWIKSWNPSDTASDKLSLSLRGSKPEGRSEAEPEYMSWIPFNWSQKFNCQTETKARTSMTPHVFLANSKITRPMCLFLSMTATPSPCMLDPPIHVLFHPPFFKKKKKTFLFFFMLSGRKKHCIKFSHFTLGGLLDYLK